MGMNSEPGFYGNHPWGGRVISKEEAYEVLRKSEEAGLVHMTSNVASGHGYICNCCGCCCGLLRGVNMGLPNVVNSYYYASINSELCSSCGICAEERCQVNAIEEGEDAYNIIKDKCIGCGLCVTTCPERCHSVAGIIASLAMRSPLSCTLVPSERGQYCIMVSRGGNLSIHNSRTGRHFNRGGQNCTRVSPSAPPNVSPAAASEAVNLKSSIHAPSAVGAANVRQIAVSLYGQRDTAFARRGWNVAWV